MTAQADLVAYARALHQRGWVANHDGNITLRMPGDRFLITPTAVSKRVLDESMLVVVDAQGQKVSGRLRPFGELGLHLTVYGARPDVGAVIHAHPPHATGYAWAHRPLFSPPASPEPVVSLGPEIPLVPYARPGAEAEAALRPFARTHHTALLASHGVISWGPDLETAFLRMELVEHIARCSLVADQLGGARPIPMADVDALLAKRAKAGLAPPGPAQGEASEEDLAEVIGREVARALRGR